jgi:hypothetical protein
MFNKILTGIAACVLLLVMGFITYDLSQTQVTATIDLKSDQDPFEVIPQIVPGQIQSVREVDKSKNEYEVVFRTHKKKGLLEWLLGSRAVEDAKIRE